MSSNPDFSHFLGKARDAKRGGEPSWRSQSTGEKLAVALALNRADWLAAMGYSIPEAIARVGSDWISMVPDVAKAIANDDE